MAAAAGVPGVAGRRGRRGRTKALAAQCLANEKPQTDIRAEVETQSACGSEE